MRTIGSVSDFITQRNNSILSHYRKLAKQSAVINIAKISNIISNSPAPRFWVSEERATIVVSAMLTGRADKYLPASTRNLKKRMFEDICNKVVCIMEENQDATIANAVWLAVNSRAPQYYMCPRTIADIIYNQIKSK